MLRSLPLEVALALAIGCAPDEGRHRGHPSANEPVDLPPEPILTGVFTDVTAEAGLDWTPTPVQFPACDRFPHPFECWSLIFQGAAAVADFDGDGWQDVYLTRNPDPVALYRNLGDGTFEDVAEEVGLAIDQYAAGGAWADIDNDGDPDLLVATIGPGPDRLFVNQGGVFTEEGQARGAAGDPGIGNWGMSVAWGDVDRDGWVDAYVAHWGWHDLDGPGFGDSDTRLMRNLGPANPGSFEDITVSAGVSQRSRAREQAFAPAFVDLDRDGWQDLALVSDGGASTLFWNEGGHFVDGTDAAGVSLTGSEMGSTFGDYDQDGDLDWMVTAISCEEPFAPAPTCTGNNLYRNEGDRSFTWATDELGVGIGHWGWGVAFFDADRDGDLDLAQTNGQWYPFPDFDDVVGGHTFDVDPMRMWVNSAGVMFERSEALGLVDTGEGKGLLVFDYDRDGDQDLLIANTRTAPRLYRNDLNPRGRSLRVELTGTTGNRDALGAVVEVERANSPTLVQEVGVSTHFQGQSERALVFGLGTDRVVEVRVTWPRTGEVQRFTGVGRTLEVVE